jgi:hypothetical protein
MGIIIAILSVLLVLSVALNFGLWKVLKNTYSGLMSNLNQENDDDGLEDLILGLRNFENNVAYDGEYYPGHLLLEVLPNEDSKTGVMQIMDFSLYESHKIIGCQTFVNGANPESYGSHMVPGVVVFQPMEGVWTWKCAWE